MSGFNQPCPDPALGRRCPLCGGRYVCDQPARPKMGSSATVRPVRPKPEKA